MDAYLREIGMFAIFQSHVKELRILFEGSDLGEVYAIAMAKTLGCISVVTDDRVNLLNHDPCPCGSGKKYKKCCGKNI